MMLYPAGGYCGEYFPLIAVAPPIPVVVPGAGGALHRHPALAPEPVRAYARLVLALPRVRALAIVSLPPFTADIRAELLLPLIEGDVITLPGNAVAEGALQVAEPTVMAVAAIGVVPRRRRRTPEPDLVVS